MRRARITILIAFAAAVAGALVLGRTLRHPGAVAEMRGTVARLRSAAESCRLEISTEHEGLLRYNERLDSMRQRVRELESLHPRGVPADSYDVYMGIFHRYNDSAGLWQARVDRLQQELDSCRVRADAHNVAVDSLRRLLHQSRR